ncbi:MAG TPA: lysophospholipid acyltransferase family protein [Pirellulales bacterium]|jgi:1-acyl-sn-glycerol-3-phosphate acyltransferase|nr:lysophospholipid acyltransferase family protein [Pirellulales bacterium]
MAKRSLCKRLEYRAVQAACQLIALAAFRVRCRGREFVPAEGGAFLLSNHQSLLDPVLIGGACARRLNFVARNTLFRFAPLRLLIGSLDAIPIDREGLSISGLKETLRRVRDGELVLLFPEGTRTHDGEIALLKGGFAALARRARVPLLPVAIEGAFDAWPRTRRFPRPGKIDIEFGPPLEPETIAGLDESQLIAEIQRRLRACHAAARIHRQERM